MTLKNKRTISYENNSHNQMLLKLINQFILRWLNSCNNTRIFIDAIKIIDKMSVGTDAVPET
jgi:hypothetical protein